MDVLGLLVAILSGCCQSLAAASMSYPVQKAAHDCRQLTKAERSLGLVMNLALTGSAVGLGCFACSLIPVALFMPLAVAASLVSNLIMQKVLCLAKLTNETVVGTAVVVSAVLLLPKLGPRPGPGPIDAMALLVAPEALAFVTLSLMVCISSLVMVASGYVPAESEKTMLFMYALVCGTGTVLNTSIQKLMSCELLLHLKGLLITVYVMLSIICLVVGALANGTLKDPSLFVPVSNGVNLVLNCLAGLMIWGDAAYLNYPRSYFLLYALVVLGTYLVSSVDVFSTVHLQVQDRLARFAGMTVRPACKQREPLLRDHGPSDAKGPGYRTFPRLCASIDLLNACSKEMSKGMLTQRDMARLCSNLLADSSTSFQQGALSCGASAGGVTNQQGRFGDVGQSGMRLGSMDDQT